MTAWPHNYSWRKSKKFDYIERFDQIIIQSAWRGLPPPDNTKSKTTVYNTTPRYHHGNKSYSRRLKNAFLFEQIISDKPFGRILRHKKISKSSATSAFYCWMSKPSLDFLKEVVNELKYSILVKRLLKLHSKIRLEALKLLINFFEKLKHHKTF